MTTSTVRLEQETYLPGGAQENEVARLHDFLERRPVNGFLLAGPGEHERVELPEEVYRLLVHVVGALSSGRAVTVAPQSTTLTTQQAADILNVSRPTLVKLLETGKIPFERVDHRRKVLLRDVLAFRERRRRAQYDALDRMSIDVENEDDAAEVVERLRAARRGVATRKTSGDT